MARRAYGRHKVPLATTEPQLRVPLDAVEEIGTRFATCARPWSVIGIGAFHPVRDWPDEYWAEFLAGLRRATQGTVFLIGGVANRARAQSFIAGSAGAAAINACNFHLGEVLALLRLSDLFVGTDSGPMNLAAAVATPAFVLFGVNRVLTYSKFIHPITPEGGPCLGGMTRIAPAEVLERVKPYLLLKNQLGRGLSLAVIPPDRDMV